MSNFDNVREDKVHDYENGFITFEHFSTETNNNNINSEIGQFKHYKIIKTKDEEKLKKQETKVDKKVFEKKANITNLQNTVKGNNVVQENKKLPKSNFSVGDTVFTIKNPFFYKSAEQIKGMPDTERKSLWATPIQLSELTSEENKWKTVITSSKQQSNILTALFDLIEARNKTLKQSQNALLMEDFEFLVSYESDIQLKEG